MFDDGKNKYRVCTTNKRCISFRLSIIIYTLIINNINFVLYIKRFIDFYAFRTIIHSFKFNKNNAYLSIEFIGTR